MFPASGPAFITTQPGDDRIQEYVNTRKTNRHKIWLIGSSTGSLRALSVFYNNSTKPIANAYKAMVWYPWSTPTLLGNLMTDNIQLPYKNKDKTLIDRESDVIPVVLVSYMYIPPLLAIIICILCSLVGYHGLIYQLGELHIYMPTWAAPEKFPLIFNKQIRHRFRTLTSDNIDTVLYSSCRLPLLMKSNGPLCDGALLSYYLNATARDNTLLTLIGDVPISSMCRTLTDWRAIKTNGCRVILGNSNVSIMDWFNPLYVIYPHLRIAKWESDGEM